ncbi:phage baseplate assembly protein V [Paraburkholderia susongensis]|uniref:Phage baseplate assembly protein V n=1 Tax=Paraburkholderia susongensis TaxID=1515439 RepID=A0A1X7I4I4_9BURK|nr:phage baseplate assembly protein V [Paraburkholderia susongensis]SMG09332.1 phage baseplate assembly protein V [Paraburkholderia susongensis]
MSGMNRFVAGVLARCTVLLANSATKMQTLQIRLLSGETKGGIEHFEPYGFTSCPLPGAEGIAGFPGGDRSHCVALVVADRATRLTGLERGEVALYTHEGTKVVLKSGRIVEIECDEYRVRTKTYSVEADLFELDATRATASCAIEAPDLKIGDVSHATHRHDETGSITGGPRS